jgi:hypothetical protein
MVLLPVPLVPFATVSHEASEEAAQEQLDEVERVKLPEPPELDTVAEEGLIW